MGALTWLVLASFIASTALGQLTQQAKWRSHSHHILQEDENLSRQEVQPKNLVLELGGHRKIQESATSCRDACFALNVLEPCFADTACVDSCGEGDSCLGCNAAGLGQDCRFCGFSVYGACPGGTPDSTPAPGPTTGQEPTPVATPVPTAPGVTAVPTEQYDDQCSQLCGVANPSEPCFFDDTCPGRLGCGALLSTGSPITVGLKCRFCGFSSFDACPGGDPTPAPVPAGQGPTPVATPVPTAPGVTAVPTEQYDDQCSQLCGVANPSEPCFFDDTCPGRLGCGALLSTGSPITVGLKCRFCGFSSFDACPGGDPPSPAPSAPSTAAPTTTAPTTAAPTTAAPSTAAPTTAAPTTAAPTTAAPTTAAPTTAVPTTAAPTTAAPTTAAPTTAAPTTAAPTTSAPTTAAPSTAAPTTAAPTTAAPTTAAPTTAAPTTAAPTTAAPTTAAPTTAAPTTAAPTTAAPTTAAPTTAAPTTAAPTTAAPSTAAPTTAAPTTAAPTTAAPTTAAPTTAAPTTAAPTTAAPTTAAPTTAAPTTAAPTTASTMSPTTPVSNGDVLDLGLSGTLLAVLIADAPFGFSEPGPLSVAGTDLTTSTDFTIEVPDGSPSLQLTGVFTGLDGSAPQNTQLVVYSIASDGSDTASSISRGRGLVSPIDGAWSFALTDIPSGTSQLLLSFVLTAPEDGEVGEGVNGKRRLQEEAEARNVYPMTIRNLADREDLLAITLTWDDGDSDVDLFVYEPDNTLVSFVSKQGRAGFLDVDNRIGFGPENYVIDPAKLTTVENPVPNTRDAFVETFLYGEYFFGVQLYSAPTMGQTINWTIKIRVHGGAPIDEYTGSLTWDGTRPQSPEYSVSVEKKHVLVLGDRSLVDFIDPVNHYTLDMWVGPFPKLSLAAEAEREYDIADFAKRFTAKLMEPHRGIELCRKFGFQTWKLDSNFVVPDCWKEESVTVAFIFESSRAESVRPIQVFDSATEADEFWERVLRIGVSYPWAEKPQEGWQCSRYGNTAVGAEGNDLNTAAATLAAPTAGTTSRWPRTLYQVDSLVLSVNNSNTFVRWLLAQLGLPAMELGGLHPGRDVPADVDVLGNAFSTTYGGLWFAGEEASDIRPAAPGTTC